MISIIIPAFNAEKVIGRALATATAQTYKDTEIIVVDDGSTDGTLGVCDSFLRKGALSIFRTAHRGVSHARNYGIEVSRGDLIYFLDADDYMNARALEHLYNGYKRSKLPMIVGGACRLDGEKETYAAPALTSLPLLSPGMICGCVVDYIATNHVYLVSHCWGRLYERKFIGDVRFDERVKLGEDGIFNLALFSGNPEGVLIINKPLYFFQQHPSSSNRPLNGDSVEHDLGQLYYALVRYFVRIRPSYNYIEKVRPHIASLFISQLIRATGTTTEEVKSLLRSSFVQKMLQHYSPKVTQSKIIPVLMRMKLAWLTRYFCNRRRECSR